jgi:hypothetical protein
VALLGEIGSELGATAYAGILFLLSLELTPLKLLVKPVKLMYGIKKKASNKQLLTSNQLELKTPASDFFLISPQQIC